MGASFIISFRNQMLLTNYAVCTCNIQDDSVLFAKPMICDYDYVPFVFENDSLCVFNQKANCAFLLPSIFCALTSLFFRPSSLFVLVSSVIHSLYVFYLLSAISYILTSLPSSPLHLLSSVGFLLSLIVFQSKRRGSSVRPLPSG